MENNDNNNNKKKIKVTSFYSCMQCFSVFDSECGKSCANCLHFHCPAHISVFTIDGVDHYMCNNCIFRFKIDCVCQPTMSKPRNVSTCSCCKSMYKCNLCHCSKNPLCDKCHKKFLHETQQTYSLLHATRDAISKGTSLCDEIASIITSYCFLEKSFPLFNQF